MDCNFIGTFFKKLTQNNNNTYPYKLYEVKYLFKSQPKIIS